MASSWLARPSVRPSARLSVWVTDGGADENHHGELRPTGHPPSLGPSVDQDQSFSMWVGFTVADRAIAPNVMSHR